MKNLFQCVACPAVYGLKEHLWHHLVADHLLPNSQAMGCPWSDCSMMLNTGSALVVSIVLQIVVNFENILQSSKLILMKFDMLRHVGLMNHILQLIQSICRRDSLSSNKFNKIYKKEERRSETPI